MENECTSHNFRFFAIVVPKIIEICETLTKFWQKQICTVIFETWCTWASALEITKGLLHFLKMSWIFVYKRLKIRQSFWPTHHKLCIPICCQTSYQQTELNRTLPNAVDSKSCQRSAVQKLESSHPKTVKPLQTTVTAAGRVCAPLGHLTTCWRSGMLFLVVSVMPVNQCQYKTDRQTDRKQWS